VEVHQSTVDLLNKLMGVTAVATAPLPAAAQPVSAR
jgi:hypothetical protein